MKKFLNWLALDHRSLGHQRLFWVAIFLPIFLFAYFGWFYWKGLDFQWNSEGFSHFIAVSKFPLTLLALILPFTALVTSWHRSIQTAKQIEETQVKNTADLYYAHLKFFIERLEGNSLIRSPIQLHALLYPQMTYSNHSLKKNQSIVNSIKELQTNFSNIIDKWRDNGPNSTALLLVHLLQNEILTSTENINNEWIETEHMMHILHETSSINEKEARELYRKSYSDWCLINNLVNM